MTRCPHCSTPLTLTLAAEPAKERPKFVFERGDVVTQSPARHYLYRNRKCYVIEEVEDMALRNTHLTQRQGDECDVTRPEIIAHLDSLGFDAVFPDDKPEPAKADEKPAEAKVETKFDSIRKAYANSGFISDSEEYIVDMLDNLNARLAKVEGKNP